MLDPINAGTALRILLVDDDHGSLESLQSFLTVEGHVTFAAAGGAEALDIVRELKRTERRLDLSILDYNMPDETGVDLFRKLSCELPGLEAIFVTGQMGVALERTVHAVGARALVPKPVDVGRMRNVLHEFGRERRRRI